MLSHLKDNNMYGRWETLVTEALTERKCARRPANSLMMAAILMHEALTHLARCIQQHLLEILPDLDEDWWGKNVVNRLTFQQQRQVSEKNISALEQLDLASLLRVLDQNWQEIRAKTELPFEARNWLKEAQNIRNRWAHLPVGGLPPEDIYRDSIRSRG